MASPVNTSVKYFHSGMIGAPVMSGTPGAMIAVLDATLVNGFGLCQVDSIVVSGGVATCNISTEFGAIPESVIQISGATPAGLNGEQKVTAVGTNKVMFATALPDQTATGSISVKLPSAGWEKPFSGTNKAAYRQPDVTSMKCYLRVDDTGTNSARVRGYETMTDIDNGSGQFPTDTQQPTTPYWAKSDIQSGAARQWMLFADSKSVLLFVASCSSYVNAHGSVSFGDLIPSKANDPFCCALAASLTDESAQPYSNPLHRSQGETYSHNVTIVRSHTGIGTPMQCSKYFPAINNNINTYYSGITNGLKYPNAADGGLYLARLSISQTGQVLRGVIAGLYPVAMNVDDGSFSNRQVLPLTEGLPNRKVVSVSTNGNTSANVAAYTCPLMVDVTGPWR